MEALRYLRIAEISNMPLEDAENSLALSKMKLQQLNGTEYTSNIPTDIFLESHLVADDVCFLEKRLTHLLDQQLDEYYSSSAPSYSWDKKEACRKLREAIEKESIVLPLDKLVSILYSALWQIPHNDKVEVLRNVAVILGTESYIGVQRAKDLLEECNTFQ